MKQPKTKLFLAVVCLVVPLLFASCSKDEENDHMQFVHIEQDNFTSNILQPNINYSTPINEEDEFQFLKKAVGTYEGTLTVYDPKTKQVIPSEFDNHVTIELKMFHKEFLINPVPLPFISYALKKDQYAYDDFYRIITNRKWYKDEKMNEFLTNIIGRNKNDSLEVAFNLYDSYHFYSYIVEDIRERYDLTELYFSICGTINNKTKELTVYIRPEGALFYDRKIKNNKIKAEMNGVYYICKLKKTAL